MELLLSLSYCRRGITHAWVIAGAEVLLVSNYCRRGNTHACVIVSVELLVSWS